MFLLIRTKDRLRDSMLAFKDAGFKTEALPISTVKHLKLSPEDMKTDGFIVTSPQGVICVPQTRLPFFCVGDKTAQEALEMGHRVAAVGEGGAADLAASMKKKFPPQNLVHICGDTADKSWYSLLESDGYTIQTRVVYTTDYIEQLSTETVQKINNNNYQCLVFYSAAGAKQFVDLAVRFGVNLSQLKAVALSDQVQAELRGFGEIKVAIKPNESAIIDAAKKITQQD